MGWVRSWSPAVGAGLILALLPSASVSAESSERLGYRFATGSPCLKAGMWRLKVQPTDQDDRSSGVYGTVTVFDVAPHRRWSFEYTVKHHDKETGIITQLHATGFARSGRTGEFDIGFFDDTK